MASLFLHSASPATRLPTPAYDFNAAGISSDRLSWPNSGMAGGVLEVSDPPGVSVITVAGSGGPNNAAYVSFTGTNYYRQPAGETAGITGTQERTMLTIYRAPQNQGIWGWGVADFQKLFDFYTFNDNQGGGPTAIRHIYGNEFYSPPQGYRAPPDWSVSLERFTVSPTDPAKMLMRSWAGGATRTSEEFVVNTTDSALRLGQDTLFLATQARDIVRVLIWDRALTPAEIQAVREYVFSRYQILC